MADFRFKYRKFELYGLGMYGHDTNQLVTGENSNVLTAGPPVNFSGGFAEGEYWFYPWLIGIMRYDIVNSPMDFQSGVSQNFTRNRFSPGVQVLLRANIKALFEYQRRWEAAHSRNFTVLPAERVCDGNRFCFLTTCSEWLGEPSVS